MKQVLIFLIFLLSVESSAQSKYYLQADRVFDGEQMHEGWVVLVENDKIVSVGPAAQISPPKDAKVIKLAGTTLLPGLIEGHSHLLLYPYNITDWDTQVL